MEREVELQGSLASQTSPDCELQIQRENLSQENKVESNRAGHLTRTSGLHMHRHAHTAEGLASTANHWVLTIHSN